MTETEMDSPVTTIDGEELDLTNYTILESLDGTFLERLSLVYIFDSGNTALVKTEDDEVYGISNSVNSHILGLETNKGPMLIEYLSGKKICNFDAGRDATGGFFMLATTEDGVLYTWGKNSYGQLGDGRTTTDRSTPTICNKLKGQKIQATAATDGYGTSVALTRDGRIYCWGYNSSGQCGNGSTAQCLVPTIIDCKTVVFKEISAGMSHCLALTKSGEVFSWGDNSYGQLGIGNLLSRPSPQKVVELAKETVKQIVCGRNHSILLTETGSIYVFGDNRNGQLGTGDTDKREKPVKIMPNTKFVQIAVSEKCQNNEVSMARTTTEVYKWGKNEKGQYFLVPTLQTATNLHQIFQQEFNITWNTLQIDTNQGHTLLLKCFADAFDSSHYSDIKFRIGQKTLVAHKTILQLRCEHFSAMFRSEMQETAGDEIEIKQYSYDVYRHFLKYIYTDQLDTSPEIAIDIIDLARSYDERHLIKLCEKTIKEKMNSQNAATLYSRALEYQMERVKKICVRYTLTSLEEVLLSDAYGQIDAEVARDLIRDYATMKMEEKANGGV